MTYNYSMNKILLPLAVLLVMVACARPGKGKIDANEEVIASFGNERITASELDALLFAFPDIKQRVLMNRKNADQFLRSYLETLALFASIRKELEALPDQDKYSYSMEKYSEFGLKGRMIEFFVEHMRNEKDSDRDALMEFYKKNKYLFETVSFYSICLPYKNAAEKQAKQGLAEFIMKSIRNGERFETLFTKYNELQSNLLFYDGVKKADFGFMRDDEVKAGTVTLYDFENRLYIIYLASYKGFDENYDAILYKYSLEHYNDDLKALKEKKFKDTEFISNSSILFRNRKEVYPEGGTHLKWKE